MLSRISIENFKALVKIDDVPLEPFTLLIGPNGSGKTTILQTIDLLGWMVTSTIDQFLEAHGWEFSDLPHLRAAHSSFVVTAHLHLGGRKLDWSVTLGARRYPGIAAESVREGGELLLERAGRDMWRLDERAKRREEISQTLTSSWLSAVSDEDQDRFPALVAIARWARGIRGYFFLDPVKLRAPNRGDGTEIGLHGEQIAPFLARLRQKDAPAFKRLTERVQRHYPRLVALHTRKRAYGWTQLEVEERWNHEQARFNARQVSDGLLRLIAVAAMHELPNRPSVLLLDEIENGLHPRLLGGFVGMLEDLVAASNGALQVIAATHSPITVNYAESARQILVVSRKAAGDVGVVRMDRARSYEKLRRYFDPGELWYNLGEGKLRP